MKIEAGKYYKTRDGRTVGPMVSWGGGKYHLGNPDPRLWDEDGSPTYGNAVSSAIISPAYPEQGTLKEIGAKPGDVVVWRHGGSDTKHRVIEEHEDYYNIIELADTDQYQEFKWAGKSTHGTWRIFSRASDAPGSPVRTVTTTRQEIVPGVYGAVTIYGIGDEGGMKETRVLSDCPMDADKLTAAIKTRTEIRDAMQ